MSRERLRDMGVGSSRGEHLTESLRFSVSQLVEDAVELHYLAAVHPSHPVVWASAAGLTHAIRASCPSQRGQ